MKNQVEISPTAQKYGNKTFEFVSAPSIVANSEMSVAYRIELQGRFTELLVFAGGTSERGVIFRIFKVES